MKKICIIANQSIICHKSQSGVAEFVDGLALSLTNAFEVYVITASRNPEFFFNFTKKIKKETKTWISATVMKVHYFILKENFDALSSVLSFINPDLIQLVDFEVANLPKSIPTIYAIDEHEPKEKYTQTIVLSSEWADHYHCLGLDEGILTNVFTPTNGLFIPKAFSKDNLIGKLKCKEELCTKYSLDKDKALYLYIGRLFWKKGIQYFPKLAKEIVKNNGQFLCVGPTQDNNILDENIIHINQRVSPVDIFSFLAAADFYIACSVQDIGPLMPRHACGYGAIPIVTQVTGMKKLFNQENAIIYTGAQDTIKTCMNLYNNLEQLQKKRITCMSWDFSWQQHIQSWIDLYNSIIEGKEIE